MLVLTRKIEEQIRIGDDITISILRVKGNTVRVGIDAPREIRVVRGELPRHDEFSGQGELPRTEGNDATRVRVTRDLPLRNRTAADAAPSEDGDFSEPATTAVRKFLASRARRAQGKNTAGALTRSA